MSQQSIEFENQGMTLRGTAYRPEKPGRHPAVLMLHGFLGNRMEAGFGFVKLGRVLAQKGIVAVAFDFRHSGESDGSFDQMLVTGEVADAVRMTSWLQGQPYVDRSRLGVLGFSLGGLVASCVSARTGAFRAMALWAPTTVKNICRMVDDAEKGQPVVRGVHTINPLFADDCRTLDPIADIARHPRATLLIQGTGDTLVAPSVSQEYIDAMKRSNVDLTVEYIADADHGFSKLPHRIKLQGATADWFEKRLK